LARTVHGILIYCTAYINGRPKPIYGHTVTEPVAQCHIRYRIYGIPRIRCIYGHTVWANPNYDSRNRFMQQSSPPFGTELHKRTHARTHARTHTHSHTHTCRQCSLQPLRQNGRQMGSPERTCTHAHTHARTHTHMQAMLLAAPTSKWTPAGEPCKSVQQMLRALLSAWILRR